MSGAMNELFSGFSQGGCCGWFLGVLWARWFGTVGVVDWDDSYD